MSTTHPLPVIGLLGAPGSGKSHVARVLAGMGGFVIDADALSRDAMQHPEVVAAVRERWGDPVVMADGSIDRRAVAGRVFSQPDELAWLESQIHPRVSAGRAALREQAREDAQARFVVEDCPLLLESGLEDECDILLMVDAPRELRLARVAQRGWTSDDLTAREDRQLPLDTKRAKADYVVVNDSDDASLAARLFPIVSQTLGLVPDSSNEPSA